MKNKARKNGLYFEIQFYERLLAANPEFTDVLIPLAELYTKVGKYRQGLSIDRKLSKLKPDDAIVYYNMACSYALLGKCDEGFASLQKAIDLGYDDFSYLDNDPDMRTLREDSRYQRLVADVVRRKKELRHGMDAGNR